MTDHPACYDFVKEATECRCSSRGAQNKVVLPRKIVRSSVFVTVARSMRAKASSH